MFLRTFSKSDSNTFCSARSVSWCLASPSPAPLQLSPILTVGNSAKMPNGFPGSFRKSSASLCLDFVGNWSNDGCPIWISIDCIVSPSSRFPSLPVRQPWHAKAARSLLLTLLGVPLSIKPILSVKVPLLVVDVSFFFVDLSPLHILAQKLT